MTTIELVTNDQSLTLISNSMISSGEQNTVNVHVEFDEDWHGYAKSAVFFTSNDRNTVYEKVLVDDECKVPAEVMVKAGILYIGVRGVNSVNNEVKTTSLVKYKVVDGAPSGTGTEIEPTPSVYDQLSTAIENKKKFKTIDGYTLSFFVGTQAEYEQLSAEEKDNTFAIITDDTTKDELFNAFEALQIGFDELKRGVTDGSFPNINRIYYLGTKTDELTLTNANLSDIREPGVYFIPYSAIYVLKKITDLPKLPSEQCNAELIVENRWDDGANNLAIHQTLRFFVDSNTIPEYRRSIYRDASDKSIKVGRWKRFVGYEELVNGDLTVMNAKNAENDSDGNPINTTYLKSNAPTENANKKLTTSGYYYVYAMYTNPDFAWGDKPLADFGVVHWQKNGDRLYSAVGLDSQYNQCFLNVSADGTMAVYVNGRTEAYKFSGDYTIYTAKLG